MPITLTPAEIAALTGGLVQPAAQLRALHAAGFLRARIGPHGHIILERTHYRAVCHGTYATGRRPPNPAPTLGVVR